MAGNRCSGKGGKTMEDQSTAFNAYQLITQQIK